MKRKDGNCVWILSDQEEAAAASNFSEYNMANIMLLFRNDD